LQREQLGVEHEHEHRGAAGRRLSFMIKKKKELVLPNARSVEHLITDSRLRIFTQWYVFTISIWAIVVWGDATSLIASPLGENWLIGIGWVGLSKNLRSWNFWHLCRWIHKYPTYKRF
jgi:hypothetical protein